ncbi:hypothetical protein [Kordia sp.]
MKRTHTISKKFFTKEVHLLKFNNYNYQWQEYLQEFKVQEHHI